jgi:hypothetical protein
VPHDDLSQIERSIKQSDTLERVMERLELLERGQRVSLRRIRRLPDLTATAIVNAITRRALVYIGVGIAIGSAFGGAGIELAKKAIAMAIGGP